MSQAWFPGKNRNLHNGNLLRYPVYQSATVAGVFLHLEILTGKSMNSRQGSATAEDQQSIDTHLVNTIHSVATEGIELDCEQWPLYLVHVKFKIESLAQSNNVIQLTELKTMFSGE